MSLELILTLGLLTVMALPGLLLGLIDRLGTTEIRTISRTTDEESSGHVEVGHPR